MATKLPLPISRDEFCETLVRLCVANRLRTWPKKARDRQVLLKSIAMRFAEGEALDEALVNERITGWLGDMGARGRGLDQVELRRTLVDHGYLSRNADGRRYQLQPRPLAFASDVDDIDIPGTLDAARSALAARKARFATSARPPARDG